MKSVSVIGGGLAGCEAAYVIAESGIHVNLFEMKPGKHSGGRCARGGSH